MQHLISKLARHVTPLLLAFAFLAQIALQAQTQSPAHDGFNPNVDGLVYASALQADGKLVIVGSFKNIINGAGLVPVPRLNIARLNRDGSVDTSFDPGIFLGPVTAVAIQSDGYVLAGGNFTVAGLNSTPRIGLVRFKTDGTVDTAFTPCLSMVSPGFPLDFAISTIVPQSDGKILVAGRFNNYTAGPAISAATRVSNLVRLKANGSLDTTLDIQTNEIVTSVLPRSDGGFYIGGGFSTVKVGAAGTAQTRNRMARILPDGSIDATFNPNFDNRVNAMIYGLDGSLIVAGKFLTLQPSGATGAINSRFLASLTPSGSFDAGYEAKPDAEVLSLSLQADGRLLIGGYFSALSSSYYVGSITSNFLARYTVYKQIDTTFRSGVGAAVTSINSMPDGKILLTGYFARMRSPVDGYDFAAKHVARLYPDGSPDLDFAAARTGTYSSIVSLSDGSMLVGGGFSNVGGVTRNNIAKIKATGEVDSSFVPQIDGSISVIFVQKDGKILIGGSFTQVGGVDHKYMARLNADGTLDTSFNVVLDAPVRAIAEESSGSLLIGGDFTTVGDASRYFLARLSAAGALDTNYDPRPSSSIRSILVLSDGKVMFGGSFTYFTPGGGKAVPINYLARLKSDGGVDDGFSSSLNSDVDCMQLLSDGRLVVGGSFSGVTAKKSDGTIVFIRNMAIVDSKGDIDSGFAPAFNGPVLSLNILSDGRYVVGGTFTTFDTTTRTNLALVNKDGTLNASFDPSPDGYVSTTALLKDGRIVVGGGFGQLRPNAGVGFLSAPGIAVLTAAGASAADFNLSGAPNASGRVNTLLRQVDGRFIAGGLFPAFGGSTSANLTRFLSGGQSDTTFQPAPDGEVLAVSTWPLADSLSLGSTSYAWLSSDGTRVGIDLANAASLTGRINCFLPLSSGQVLVGGTFTYDKDTNYKNLVRLQADGSLDLTFNPAPDNSVFMLKRQANGKILVGGLFTSIAGLSRNSAARLNADFSLDATFNPNLNGSLIDAAFQSDGKIILAGGFTTIYGTGTASVNRLRLARVGEDGSLDTSWDPAANEQVNSISLLSDGRLLVGGQFSGFSPNAATTVSSRNYLARLKADGTLDTDFNPNPNGPVSTLSVLGDGKILVGGAMLSWLPNGATTSIAQTGWARLNTDGTLDTTLNLSLDGAILQYLPLTDGSYILAGNFSKVLGATRNRLVRISSTGTLLPELNPVATSQTYALAQMPNGQILVAADFTKAHAEGMMLVGGSFSRIGGKSLPYLARLYVDGVADPLFSPSANGPVHTISRLVDGRSYVGGEFSSIGGQAMSRLARLQANGTTDTGFKVDCNGTVRTSILLADGRLLIGGSFTSVGGSARSRLALLNPDGTVDTSFAAGANGDVTSLLLVRPGVVAVGGSFTSLSSVPSAYLAVIYFNGTSALPVPAINGPVASIAVAADGGMTIAGSFTKVGTQDRAGFARITPAGTVDTVGAIPVANGAITALLLDEDGKTLVGGSFSKLDELARYSVARLGIVTSASQSLLYDLASQRVQWNRSGGLPVVERAFLEVSADNSTWTSLGEAVAQVSGGFAMNNVSLPENSLRILRIRGLLRTAAHGSEAYTQFITASYPATLPLLPTSSTVVLEQGEGSSILLPSLSGRQTLSITGLPTGLSYNVSTGSISGTSTTPGTYSVSWTLTDGFNVRLLQQTWYVYPSTTAPAGSDVSHRLVNLSSRLDLKGTETGILGFVVSGTSPKNILIRAAGPSLAGFGITKFVARPQMSLRNSDRAEIGAAGAWNESAQSAEFVRLGAFPFQSGSADSAMLVTLQPGLYTVLISDQAGLGGTVLGEVYDAGASLSETQRLLNLSARGPVEGSNRLLIGGFVVSGSGTQTVLVRAAGPSLTAFGVTDANANPTIKIYDSAQKVVAENDDWQIQQQTIGSYQPYGLAQLTAFQSKVGAFTFQSGSLDSAVLIDLPAGAYTVIVTGLDAQAGSVLAEVYQLQK